MGFRETADLPLLNAGRRRLLSLSNIAGIFCALLFSAITAWLVADLEVARIYVAGILLFCFCLELRFRQAFLLYIPMFLPIADMGLWSGRIYIDEFDILVLATAAAHFWHASLREEQIFPHLTSRGSAVTFLLLASFLASAVIGAWPLPYPDATQLSNYLSNYNSIRILKAAVWAVLLLAPLQICLKQQNASRCATLLMLGTSLGLIFVGLIVLWERGIFLAIAQAQGLYAGRWAILGALLDFTWEYRATALFTELHTGGEAMDTYLALALPIAAAGALVISRNSWRVLCFVGLGFGTYAAVAGYSRSLYASCCVGLALTFILAIRQTLGSPRSSEVRPGLVRILVALAVSECVFLTSYDYGGWTGLVYAIGIAAAGLAVALIGTTLCRVCTTVGLVTILSTGSYALFRAFSQSKYNAVEPSTAILLAVISVTALLGSSYVMATKAVPLQRRAAIALLAAVVGILNVIGVPAFAGTRMLDRLTNFTADAQGRWDHWMETLRLMDANWADYTFGEGLGSFPRIYFRRGISPETKVSFLFQNDAKQSFVELGVGDYNLTQKISLLPYAHYRLRLLIRASEPGASLGIKFCPKVILYADRYTPGCPEFEARPEPLNVWVAREFELDSGALGGDGLLGWPITVLLHNGATNSAVDVTNIELMDGNRNIITNGNFSTGGDHWIFISDFEHLAWHIKDVYLQIFFESGAIGLAIFLIALSLALAISIKQSDRSVIGPAFAGALASIILLGFFASIFDNPRPATLLLFIMFWALDTLDPLAIVQIGREDPVSPVLRSS